MARELTESDAQQIYEAEKGLRESGLDVDHEHAKGNGNLILQYFQQNPQVPITVASIYAFVEKNKNQLIWRTPAQREYDKIAAEDPAKAQQLADYLATQGKPGQLVNTGDQAFDNHRLLLLTLRGYEISPARIRDAEDRIANKPGEKLQYVPEPRRVGPRSEAAKNDDPNRKPGQFVSDYNEPEWVRRSRERSEREAREAASQQQSSASAQAAAVRAAKQKAEGLRGATGSEDEQLQAIFVTNPGTSEINWPETLAARSRMQQSFNKAREVRRFIR